jgi:hypothetical protein
MQKADLFVYRTLALLVLWPLPMYGSKYVFSKTFFTGWVSVAIIWIFVSIILVGILPLWESRETIVYTVKAMFSGKIPPKHPVTVGTEKKSADDGVISEKKLESEEVTAGVTQ